LSWDDNTNADYFEIYRIEGTCDSIDQRQFRYIGRSEQTQFRDNDNLSAFRYAYKIRPAQFKELGPLSDCIDIESTRVCNDPPNFDQNTVVVANSTGDLCHVELQWQSVNSVCPSASGVRYNVYRSQENNFIPDSSNLIASTNLGATGFDDIFAPSGVPTFYIVTAEDNTTVGNGPNQGNESNGNKQVVATTLATSSTVGNLLEDIDNVALMSLNEPWQITNRRASDSILSYHSGPDVGNYPSNTCGRMISKSFELPANGNAPELSYQARYDFEQNWDGVVLEISTDNGVTWTDLPPNEGYPSSFSQTGTPPINICQYESTHGAFSGSSNGSFQTFTHDLSAFAGQSILLRWSISTDPNTEAEGFYIDNIQYKNINVPNACTVNTAAARPKPGFYFDRAKNGHGFVIEPIANTDLYFTIFYTYKEDGTPEWYTSQPTLENNVLNINSLTDPAAGALNRFIYDFNVDPIGAGNPNTLDDTVGESFLKVDFNEAVATAANACNDGFDRGDNQAVATWKIGDETGQWCVEPLANVIGNPLDPDFGGTWWAGIDDDGWGFSLAFTGDTIVVIIYYFDANGSPRWALGTQAGYQLGQEITLDMLEFAGFARDATAIELETVSTGALTLTINSRTGTGNDGNINLDINYQGIEGGNWNRTNVPITIFTEAH
ncbi:MAG TPA: hypothetical protein ENJ41_02405, partial [Oceanospirillales bacterium]|nr:hypothetical protein [Oceanospirillales bacterium]